MIKTETSRWIVTDESGVKLPDDVRRAVNEWNRTHSIQLDILWDAESAHWQIYRIKLKGVTSGDDTLHWQMQAPSEGTTITPGILDWLKKYDTSNNGYLDKEEITNNWKKLWKEGVNKINKRKNTEREDLEYGRKFFIDDLITQKTVGSVPITVGFNKRTGKKIIAVPKRAQKGLIIP